MKNITSEEIEELRKVVCELAAQVEFLKVMCNNHKAMLKNICDILKMR